MPQLVADHEAQLVFVQQVQQVGADHYEGSVHANREGVDLAHFTDVELGRLAYVQNVPGLLLDYM